MLHLRALGRAGKGLALRSSATLACAAPGSAVAEQAGAAARGGGWRSLLEGYGGAASRLTFAFGGREQDEEGASKAGTAAPWAARPLHTGGAAGRLSEEPWSLAPLKRGQLRSKAGMSFPSPPAMAASVQVPG